MRTPAPDPWRGAPGAHPLPRGRLPLQRGGRPRKAWRWVGIFTDDVMLCAARASIGPLAVEWWAVWDRWARTLAERTTRRSGAVLLQPGAVRIADGPFRAQLALDTPAVEGVETVSPHGRVWAWTVKRAGVPVRGWIALDDRRLDLTGHAVLDESGGYHARETAWRWCAGVGVATSGAAVAWNLVDGLHDAETASERSVWVDGRAHEVGRVTFADDLRGVGFAEGGELRFVSEATRARRDRLLLVASDYEQPFGTFAGELPGAGPLRSGLGVMERHAARW